MLPLRVFLGVTRSGAGPWRSGKPQTRRSARIYAAFSVSIDPWRTPPMSTPTRLLGLVPSSGRRRPLVTCNSGAAGAERSAARKYHVARATVPEAATGHRSGGQWTTPARCPVAASLANPAAAGAPRASNQGAQTGEVASEPAAASRGTAASSVRV